MAGTTADDQASETTTATEPAASSLQPPISNARRAPEIFLRLITTIHSVLPGFVRSRLPVTFIGYAIINGSAFFLDITCLWVFYNHFHWFYPVAVTVGYAIAAVYSFLLNRWLNFQAHGHVVAQGAGGLGGTIELGEAGVDDVDGPGGGLPLFTAGYDDAYPEAIIGPGLPEGGLHRRALPGQLGGVAALGGEFARSHLVQRRDLDRHECPGGDRRRPEHDLLSRGRVLRDARGDRGRRRGQLTAVREVSALHLGLGQGPGQGAHRAGHEGAHRCPPPARRAVLGDGDAVDVLNLLPALTTSTTHKLTDAPIAPVVHGRVPGPTRGGGGRGQEGDDGAGSGLGDVDAPGWVNLVVAHGDLHTPGDRVVEVPGRGWRRRRGRRWLRRRGVRHGQKPTGSLSTQSGPRLRSASWRTIRPTETIDQDYFPPKRRWVT